MGEVFLKVLRLSITGSWLILAVLLLRLLLRKAPNRIRCALWVLVAIRLICPIPLQSVFSLAPSAVSSGALVDAWADTYVGDLTYTYEGDPYFADNVHSGEVPLVDDASQQYVVGGHGGLTPPDTVADTVAPILGYVWITGAGVFLLYAALSYLRLKHSVGASILLRENILACDEVRSPFILGILHPQIYVPSAMDGETLDCVITHEKAHLTRHDHWWKPLGYLLLSVYWFNPLFWAAYVLLCRDIELACDEKVIRNLDREGKAAYAQALLDCSFPRRTIAACPLAFGEVGAKERVKSVLNYREPTFWAILAALAVSILGAVFLMTDPAPSRAHLYFPFNEAQIESVEVYYQYREDAPIQKVTLPNGEDSAYLYNFLKDILLEESTSKKLPTGSQAGIRFHLVSGKDYELQYICVGVHKGYLQDISSSRTLTTRADIGAACLNVMEGREIETATEAEFPRMRMDSAWEAVQTSWPDKTYETNDLRDYGKYYSMNDFKEIVIGESTQMDVSRIAPNVWIGITSYGGFSDFPTETGEIIRIKFYGPDLIVGKIEEIMPSGEDMKVHQELQGIPMLTTADVDVDLSGITVNNAPVAADARKLSITELRSFFGETSSRELMNEIYLHEIHEIFPVTYLRSIRNADAERSYYIAYPVSEGGLYIVFLACAISENWQTAQLVSTATVYLSDLPEISDLKKLQYGDSFEMVEQIAPATLISFLKSSAITSVSFLRDGTVAEITYQTEAYVKDHVLHIEQIDFKSASSFILPEDWAYMTAEQ